jgi:hypothetical protein
MRMSNNDLKAVDYQNQRVLTTEQLAEAYEASPTQIKQNFNNNKSNFVEGKHYVLLEGEELHDFKDRVDNIDLVGKNARILYLWTRRGASRHCKLLGTDKAWEQFDSLEESYFNPDKQLDTTQLSPELQMFNGLFKSLAQQELATKQLEHRVDGISEIVALNSVDWRKDANKLINDIARNRGGNEAYKSVRSEIYAEVERRGGFQLSIRLTNKRRRMADEGVSKSKRDRLSKVDVIGDDKRLIEIYLAVVKEFAIANGVEVA